MGLMLDNWMIINYQYLLDYTDKIFKGFRYKYDILNDIILKVYDIPQEKLKALIDRKELVNYVCGMIYFSKFSKKSPQRKYLNYNELEYKGGEKIDEDTINEKIEFEEKIDKVYNILYNKTINRNNGSVKLFEMYWLERFSYREISELTNMSYYRVNDNVKNVFENIKKELSGYTYKNK